MSNINVGVLLKLSDQFSPQLNKALSSSKNFANGFNGAMSKVDGALNSMTGKLAILGVSVGAAATVNKMIAFEDRINKIGTVAKQNASSTEEYKKQMDGLSEAIYKAATQPNIKVDASEIVDAIDSIMEKTGDMQFAKDNLENIGKAMRAFGASGSEIGSMMSEFAKLGYGAEEVTQLMNEMYVQGNKGAFTAKSFASYGSQIIAAYSSIGTSAKDIKNVNATMQILRMTFGSDAEAVTGLKSVMADLGAEAKQNELAKYGISVRDSNGDMRDLNDIMLDISEAQKKLKGKDIDKFFAIFGENARTSVRAFVKDGHKLKDFLELGNVAGKVDEAAADNAGSLAVNLKNLQTAFDGFANSNIAPLLAEVTKHLNWFASDPKRFDKLFKTLAIGFGVVFGAKAIMGITQFASQLRGITSMGGKGLNIPGIGASPLGGASATPVFVVNMGAGMSGGSQNFDNTPMNPNMNKSKNGLNNASKISAGTLAKAGGRAAGVAALVAIPMAVSQWQEANNDTSLNTKQRNKKKGGAVGGAVGAIGGAAAGAASGAAAGAAIGSIIPGAGTIAGAIIGGGIGLLGGYLGKKAGEHIGESLTKDDTLANKESIPPRENTATIKGNANLGVDVNITDTRITANLKTKKNDMDFLHFDTGSIDTMASYGVY